MSKNLHEAIRLQSEKRKEWIREMKGKRLQGIAEGMSRTVDLANSSFVSFSERNQCPVTHRSLIAKEEKENSSCQVCQRVVGKRKERENGNVARTKQELKRKRRERKWRTC